MADGPSSTIVFDGDSTGAVAALHAVDVAAKNTATAVNSTGAALSKVGDGADAGVDKAVNATKRFESQLKRLNLELESGGRNTAAYIEGRAKLAGADTAALAPLIAQYDQIKAKQALANAEFTKSGKVMTDYGMGVKATSAALRQVPAQFTDIIVSLQGGQAPLTVLLQQGGQLKDVFGGVGNAFKALSGYVMGLINPVTLGIAAVGTLGYAFLSGSKEAEAYNKALILTGNSAGTTANQLNAMASAVSQSTGGTIGAAADSLAQLAGAGNIAQAQFKQLAAVATEFERVSGTAVSETVKQFAELGKEPVKASEKLNESTHYLTAAIYEQIKALEDQGDKLGAAALAQSAWADALENRIPALRENLGLLEVSWRGIIGTAKSAWDAMLGIGRADSTADKISKLQAQISDTQKNLGYNPGLYGADLKAMQAQLVYLQRMQASEGSMAVYQADKIKREESSIALAKEADKYATRQVQLQRELSRAQAELANSNKTPQDYANYQKTVVGLSEKFKEAEKSTRSVKAAITDAEKGLKLYNDLMAVSTGLTADFAEKQELLSAKFAKDGNMAQYQEGMAKLIEKQPYWLEALKAEAEAIKAIDKARNEGLKSHAKELETLGDKAQKLEDEVAMYGLSKEAIEALTTARMLDQIEVLRGFDNSAEEIARIEQVIAARKRLAAAGASLDVKDVNAKAAKDMAAEQKKAAEASEKYWEDALMRAFERGKGFFESLWDTIKNTLKTQVLKVTVQGVMGSLGMGAAGAATAGDGGGLMGSASSLSSLTSLYSNASSLVSMGGQVVAGTMSAANALGTIAANATGTGITGLLATNGAYGTAAAATATTATAASSLAAAGPYVAAAVAAYMIADSLFGSKGGPKTESSYGNMAGLGDTSAASLAGTYAAGVEAAWTSLAKQLDLTTQLKVGALTSIDSAGDAQTQFGASATVNGMGVYDRGSRMGGIENVGRTEEALQAAMTEETTRILFAALKASDLPAQYTTYLNGIADSVSAMNAAIGDVTMVSGFTKALENLPFENLKNLSFDAAKGLIEMAGGLESLTAGMGAYYELFYTDAERIARTAESVSAALAGVGVSMPATKDAFRAVVDGLDITTISGRAAYVTMLALAPAFAQVADAAAQAAEASVKLMNDVFDTLEDRLTGLIESIASERDSVAGARDSILNGGPKTYAELQSGIAGAKVALPSDARVMAANAAVAVAAANVAAQGNAVKQAQALTPSTAALDAAKSTLNAAAAATAAAQAHADWFRQLDGGRFGRYVDMGVNGFNANGWNNSGERNAVWTGNALTQAQAAQAPTQAAYNANLASYNTALQSNAAKVAAAQSVLNAATAAQAAAQADAKAAILDYAEAMTQYSGDAEKAVKVLSTLREETVAYYAAQKELAGLMTTSAASLREAVRATRFGQLDSAASLAQQQGAFAQNYSLALSTTGADKAGYADKLGAALPGLSAALMDASATRADWALASSSLLTQSETIAAQLEADAGGMNYEADSLALLDSIDVALGELDSNTAILKNAIDGGSATTAAGLRAIVSQLGGVPAFASGGYHSGGVRLVGENGPELEVTGPSNIFNASQLRGGSAQDNRELVAEIRALREEVVNLRAEARSSAISNSKTARILERVTPDGSSLQTVAA